MRTPSCAVSSDGTPVCAQHTVQVLCMERFSSTVLFRVLLVFSQRNTALFIISTMKEMDVCIRTCSFSLRQGCTGDVITSTTCEVPAASSVAVSRLSLSCGQGVSATRGRPERHAGCAVSYRTAQACGSSRCLLRRSLTPQCTTVFWVGSLNLPRSSSCSLGYLQPLLRNRCPSSNWRSTGEAPNATQVHRLHSSDLSLENVLTSSLLGLSLCEMLKRYL